MHTQDLSDHPRGENESGPTGARRWRRALDWIWRPVRAARRGALGLGRAAWAGATVGAVVAVLGLMVVAGAEMTTGLGRALDIAMVLVAGVLGIAVAGLLVAGLRALFVAWPARYWAGTLGGLLFFVVFFAALGAPVIMPLIVGLPPMLLAGTLGAGVAVLYRVRTGAVGRGYLWAGVLLVVASLGGATALGAWLAARGDDPNLESQRLAARLDVPPLDAEDPAESGPYEVRTLFYGSGTDLRRPELGPGVALKTNPVDASKLLPASPGLRARIRSWYWGFGNDRLPLNGRVWYPHGDGPFPLVLMVHGNHKAQEFSDPGYAYLGELLASRGFIAVSVDENFLNGSWEGGLEKENGVRGWLLLKHLELWRRWNGEAENPFEHQVDLASIALVGHSRGGEAVTHAAAFNRLRHFPDDASVPFEFGFGIRSLVAIAPIDGQYEPADQPAPIEGVSYLVLQGSHDADGYFFAGNRPYQRVKLGDDAYRFKAALYVHRANHGQFNTVWGDNDTGSFLGTLMNRGALLSGEDQRDVARTYISGFMEATLHGREEYVPMFRDWRRAAHWLPETIYLGQFQDSHFRAVSTFDDGIDVGRTTLSGGTQAGEHLTVWKQRVVRGRGGWSFRNNAVWLGWARDAKAEPAGGEGAAEVPGYTISLPPGLGRTWALDDRARLVFSVADTDESPVPDEKDPPKPSASKEPLDFGLELVAAGGATARLRLSDVSPLQPVLKVRFGKAQALEALLFGQSWEPVFQTYEIPLSAFRSEGRRWSPSELEEIRFRFDGTPRGVIILDEVGLAR